MTTISVNFGFPILGTRRMPINLASATSSESPDSFAIADADQVRHRGSDRLWTEAWFPQVNSDTRTNAEAFATLCLMSTPHRRLRPDDADVGINAPNPMRRRHQCPIDADVGVSVPS